DTAAGDRQRRLAFLCKAAVLHADHVQSASKMRCNRHRNASGYCYSARLPCMADEPLRIPAPAPGTTEQPTTSALISLGLRPLKIETRADNVPASETRTLVTVFGMIAMGATGILGGGVTMSEAPAAHLGPYLTAAMAQLLLALAVAILIFRWT